MRVSQSERDPLKAAAEQARTGLSDADNRVATIPAEDWETFEAWVDAPAKEVPALRRLAASRSRLA